MQFLRKFLKDLEESSYEDEDEEKVKDVVTKIRDVTFRVEDAIDSVLLEEERTRAYIFRRRFRMSDKDKMKLMVIDHGYFSGVPEEIESLMAEVAAIYEMISSLSPWVAGKTCVGFQRAAAQMESIRTEVEIYERVFGNARRRSFGIDDMLSSAQKMLHVGENFKDDIHESIRIEEERLSRSAEAEEEIKSAMKGLDFSSPFYVGMCNEVRFVQFFKDIFHDIVKTLGSSLPEELVTFSKETMMRYKEELSRSWLASRMIEKVRDVIGLVVREIKSMNTETETYRSRSNFLLDDDLFSSTINDVMDVMQSIKTEMKIYENGSSFPPDSCLWRWYNGMFNWPDYICYYIGSGIFHDMEGFLRRKMDSEKGLQLVHSLIAQEFLLLSNLFESAEKIRDGFGTLIEEIEATPTEVEIHEKDWSPVLSESCTVYNRLKKFYLAEKIHHHFHSFILLRNGG